MLDLLKQLTILTEVADQETVKANQYGYKEFRYQGKDKTVVGTNGNLDIRIFDANSYTGPQTEDFLKRAESLCQAALILVEEPSLTVQKNIIKLAEAVRILARENFVKEETKNGDFDELIFEHNKKNVSIEKFEAAKKQLLEEKEKLAAVSEQAKILKRYLAKRLNIIRKVINQECVIDPKIIQDPSMGSKYHEEINKKATKHLRQFIYDMLSAINYNQKIDLSDQLSALEVAESHCVAEAGRSSLLHLYDIEGDSLKGQQRFSAARTVGEFTNPSTLRDDSFLKNEKLGNEGQLSNFVEQTVGYRDKSGKLIMEFSGFRHSSLPPIKVKEKIYRRALASQAAMQMLTELTRQGLEKNPNPDKPLEINLSSMVLLTPLPNDKLKMGDQSEERQVKETLLALNMFNHREIEINIDGKTVKVIPNLSQMNMASNPVGELYEIFEFSEKINNKVNNKGFYEYSQRFYNFVEKQLNDPTVAKTTYAEFVNIKHSLTRIGEQFNNNKQLQDLQDDLAKAEQGLPQKYAQLYEIEQRFLQKFRGFAGQWDDLTLYADGSESIEAIVAEYNAKLKEIRIIEAIADAIYQQIHDTSKIIWEMQYQENINPLLTDIARLLQTPNFAKSETVHPARKFLEVAQLYLESEKIFYDKDYVKNENGYQFQTRYLIVNQFMDQNVDWYCKSGEDRTGMLAIMVEKFLAFRRETGAFPQFEDATSRALEQQIMQAVHAGSVAKDIADQNAPGARGLQGSNSYGRNGDVKINDFDHLSAKLAKEVLNATKMPSEVLVPLATIDADTVADKNTIQLQKYNLPNDDSDENDPLIQDYDDGSDDDDDDGRDETKVAINPFASVLITPTIIDDAKVSAYQAKIATLVAANDIVLKKADNFQPAIQVRVGQSTPNSDVINKLIDSKIIPTLTEFEEKIQGNIADISRQIDLSMKAAQQINRLMEDNNYDKRKELAKKLPLFFKQKQLHYQELQGFIDDIAKKIPDEYAEILALTDEDIDNANISPLLAQRMKKNKQTIAKTVKDLNNQLAKYRHPIKSLIENVLPLQQQWLYQYNLGTSESIWNAIVNAFGFSPWSELEGKFRDINRRVLALDLQKNTDDSIISLAQLVNECEFIRWSLPKVNVDDVPPSKMENAFKLLEQVDATIRYLERNYVVLTQQLATAKSNEQNWYTDTADSSPTQNSNLDIKEVAVSITPIYENNAVPQPAANSIIPLSKPATSYLSPADPKVTDTRSYLPQLDARSFLNFTKNPLPITNVPTKSLTDGWRQDDKGGVHYFPQKNHDYNNFQKPSIAHIVDSLVNKHHPKTNKFNVTGFDEKLKRKSCIYLAAQGKQAFIDGQPFKPTFAETIEINNKRIAPDKPKNLADAGENALRSLPTLVR